MAGEEIVGNGIGDGGETGGDTGGDAGGQEQSSGKETILTAADEDPKSGDAGGEEDAKGEKKADGEDDTDEKSKDSDEKDADGDKDGAPEKYEAFKTAEGVEVDQVLMDEFTPIAKELNLTQDQAQMVADLVPKIQAKVVEAQVQEYESLTKKWDEDIKNDKEFGKGKYKETVGHAKRAISEFGTVVEGLKEALEETGAGNHPAFIKTFATIGKMIGEDSINFGKGGDGEKLPVANRMFPGMK